MMNTLGLVLDTVGAVLLIFGQLQSDAGMLCYWATGEQKDDYLNQWKQFWWWRRWPLKLGVAFGNKSRMGQESLVDSFPLTAWGIFLLIVGFLFQAVASVW